MDSCGLPFSISNLAETGLPFFLLVASPCSSVTLAPATTGARSAFSLSDMAASAGITHSMRAKTDHKIGTLGIVTSPKPDHAHADPRRDGRPSFLLKQELSGWTYTLAHAGDRSGGAPEQGAPHPPQQAKINLPRRRRRH